MLRLRTLWRIAQIKLTTEKKKTKFFHYDFSIYIFFSFRNCISNARVDSKDCVFMHSMALDIFSPPDSMHCVSLMQKCRWKNTHDHNDDKKWFELCALTPIASVKSKDNCATPTNTLIASFFFCFQIACHRAIEKKKTQMTMRLSWNPSFSRWIHFFRCIH